MRVVTNRQVADLLDEIATLMEVEGANPFRIRAYTSAVRAIESLEEDVVELVAGERLTQIKGIGKGLAGLIGEYVRTGVAAEYEQLKAAIPPGLVEMLRVRGMGPKKIRAVHEQLGIDGIEALERAGREGILNQLSGFGDKTVEAILNSIEHLRQYRGLHLIDRAGELAEELRALLDAHPDVIRTAVAGDLRRGCELVETVELIASVTAPEAVAGAFAAHAEVEEEIARDANGATVRMTGGLQARLHLVTDEQFVGRLYHLTGNREHLAQLRSRAESRGFALDEDGLRRGGELLPCGEEAALFAPLGLPFIPPELREGDGEIEAADRGELPDLVRLDDICGMLHVHSTYSDGDTPLAEMAAAVRRRGFAYLGIADHSRSAAYAGGLKEDDILRQHDQIDALNERLDGFRIFKGIESDILADGGLDYGDALLERFDFVVVSIHSRFGMAAEEMTRRIVRAVEHPASSILGHLTGRLLLEREGYRVDVDAVLEAAARSGAAVEINCHPRRLDIDWRHLRSAVERGVKLAVDTDAHTVAGLDNLRYGIGIARKGWLRPPDIINALDAEGIAAHFRGSP